MNNPTCQIHAAIAAIQLRVPGVAVTFFVGSPSELETQVLAGTLDVVIGLFASRHAALTYSVLFAEEHELYCSKNHLLSEASDEQLNSASLQNAAYVSWSYLESRVSAHSHLKFTPTTGTPFLEGV